MSLLGPWPVREFCVVMWVVCAAACSGSASTSNDTPASVSTADTGPTTPTYTEPPITTWLTEGGAETCLWVQGGNDRVRSTGSGMPTGGSDRTLQAWVRTKSLDAQVAISVGLASPGKAFYLGTEQGQMMVSNGGLVHADPNLFVADGQWHHIAVTFTRATAQLYLDGMPGVSVELADTDTSDGEIVAGGAPTTGGLSWVGWVDDVRIYGVVRTPTSLLEDRDGDERGLLLWWDFEVEGEGPGLIIPDLSATGADGVSGGTDTSPSFLACR